MFDSASKPRRGAPPGNTNAVKHGLYSRQFSRSDIKILQNAQPLNLTDEINVIRVYIRQIVELDSADPRLPALLETLRTISFACTCLTRLINTQRIVNPANNALDELRAALEEMSREYVPNAQQLPASPGPSIPPDPFFSPPRQ